jgi:hypothetical protein
VSRSIKSRCPTDLSYSIKLLGNTINGAVDSPVNGGVKLYQSVREFIGLD